MQWLQLSCVGIAVVSGLYGLELPTSGQTMQPGCCTVCTCHPTNPHAGADGVQPAGMQSAGLVMQCIIRDWGLLLAGAPALHPGM